MFGLIEPNHNNKRSEIPNAFDKNHVVMCGKAIHMHIVAQTVVG